MACPFRDIAHELDSALVKLTFLPLHVQLVLQESPEDMAVMGCKGGGKYYIVVNVHDLTFSQHIPQQITNEALELRGGTRE